MGQYHPSNPTATRRIKLEDMLNAICTNVYFNPPEGFKMAFPAIRYSLTDKNYNSADNIKYRNYDRYQLTIIDQDPDSDIVDQVLKLPYTSFDRSYRDEYLNYWVVNIYIN